MKKKSFLESLKAFFSEEAPKDAADDETRPNTWGASGRTVQMQTRTLMQMKAFERFK